MPATTTLEEAHRRNIRRGLTADPAQNAVATRLTELQRRLLLSESGRAGWRRWLRRRTTPVRGIYLWGSVGRGKTYLLDLFHETLPLADKQRLHFHRFMQRVHADMRVFAGRADPLEAVAARLASEARVLCFDEFHVSDIGDAMILAGLLAGLFDRGVTLVATSNVAPADLYEDGLQRRRFLPAIELIEQHTEAIRLDGEADYRLRVLRRDGIYRTDGDEGALRASFAALCHTPPKEDVVLTVNDRPIRARYCAEDVVWFDFDAVCDGPRANDDYIELARLFSTVVVHGVPVFDADGTEDRARRFIGLIDEFYDRNVKVLIGAEASINGLYRGERLATEFERTKSRLVEMQGDAYLRATHRP